MANNLRGSSLRGRTYGEDVDPAGGLTNLADCMLVLAVGTMAALAMYWNVDLGAATEIVDMKDVTEAPEIQDMTDEIAAGGSSYSEVGTVYKDPETGKLYMMTEDVAKVEDTATTSETDDTATDDTATDDTEETTE